MTTAPLDRQGHRHPWLHPDYPQPPAPWLPMDKLMRARNIEAVVIATVVARGCEPRPAVVAGFAAMDAAFSATCDAQHAFRRAWYEAAA